MFVSIARDYNNGYQFIESLLSARCYALQTRKLKMPVGTRTRVQIPQIGSTFFLEGIPMGCGNSGTK